MEKELLITAYNIKIDRSDLVQKIVALILNFELFKIFSIKINFTNKDLKNNIHNIQTSYK